MSKPLAEVLFGCGRCYLKVAGIAIAMQGDKCRDGNLPNEVYDPIPESELEHATIGGKSIKGMDPEDIRFFRGEYWNEKMLRYVADRINQAAAEKQEPS